MGVATETNGSMSDVCHHHYLYHAQSFRGLHTAHLSLADFARGIAWAKRDGRWCAIDRLLRMAPSIACTDTLPLTFTLDGNPPCRVEPLTRRRSLPSATAWPACCRFSRSSHCCRGRRT